MVITGGSPTPLTSATTLLPLLPPLTQLPVAILATFLSLTGNWRTRLPCMRNSSTRFKAAQCNSTAPAEVAHKAWGLGVRAPTQVLPGPLTVSSKRFRNSVRAQHAEDLETVRVIAVGVKQKHVGSVGAACNVGQVASVRSEQLD